MASKKKSVAVVPEPNFGNEKLKISFEYYDSASSKYCLSKFEKDQVREALLRLRDINGKSYMELYRQRDHYHFHQVNWKDTEEKNGFPPCGVNEFDPFQIALHNVNEWKVRVFGGIHKGTFYIVWFDLEHEIDPSMRR
ncbi:MAG: hypothetical protein WC080_04665 [Patescibacteria group bacterium]|jgi:hypothetical protein